jgi:hypothetical protein
MKNTLIISILVIVILLIGGAYLINRPSTTVTVNPGTTDNTGTTGDNTGSGNLCAQDVRLCSDGSYVSRVPPSCDFAACPVDPHADLIKVTTPQPNAKVASPLTVTGQARGNWYFEASFPVKLYDANGTLLAQKPAQAQGDWMTTNFVPFTVTLTFAKPATATGVLVLEKDNPSGLPQNDDKIEIPVTF